MVDQVEACQWCREYNLKDARNHPAIRQPAAHQSQALRKLNEWHSVDHRPQQGAILVLPTGGGKTFTAVSFLCCNPISRGQKVLWLAHTHHLLEQAFAAFEHGAPLVREPKQSLKVRVVSGTVGHFPVHTIRPDDDVIICSLQAAARALQSSHPQWMAFLEAAGEDLFVVFDEAHHSPAPSYRKLITTIRDRSSRMRLLGLTATPTYHDDGKAAWLSKLFPQGIVHQTDAQSLMAAGILSRPQFEEAHTPFEPEFDDRQYRMWASTYRDLPEDIIQHLAANRARNDSIVERYLAHKERYGRTIIFADRWHQCDYLREALLKHGVRADVVYSHQDADPGSADARRRRKSDENALVLRDFREGKLDVLINVRMLTEGTDVPDVQTVFLTRQTTSQILLTQMVGRALRGRVFGGTEMAYIVSFIDNWKQYIKWATYDQLPMGDGDESTVPYGKRPPIQLISIELVRQLSRQIHQDINVNPGPYQSLLPVGWYRVEYEAAVKGSDDIEMIRQLVLVFEGQQSRFERLFDTLQTTDLRGFAEAELVPDDVAEVVSRWKETFFSLDEQIGDNLSSDLRSVARHMAQSDGERPRFFPFDARGDHNLDSVAQQVIDDDLGPRATNDALQREFARDDRYWRTLYYHFDQFATHFDGCLRRILHAQRHGASAEEHRPTFTTPEILPEQEVDEHVKEEIKARDDNRCLCCHARSRLELDHISARYIGPSHDADNLQTLCSTCNGMKQTETIDFRKNRTLLTQSPAAFPRPHLPSGADTGDPREWEQFIRRCVNFYYRCSAVRSLEIGARGERLRRWKITLFSGNEKRWLEPHLAGLAAEIRAAKTAEGYRAGPDLIEFVASSGDASIQTGLATEESGSERETHIPAESDSVAPAIPNDNGTVVDVSPAIDTSSVEPGGDDGDPSPSIDELDRNEVLAVVRSVFATGEPRSKDQAIREVAAELGFRRVGPRVREELSKDVFTAVLRGVLQNENGEYSLLCRSIEQYTLDHLVDMLLAAIGPKWQTREESIVAAARHLGFRRTGKDIQAAFRSAINAAIRRELIDRDGSEMIRRAR